MQIVLFEPKIPQNTGNIARSCAATGCSLRLVPPMGFTLTESRLKRAGLDYWQHVDVKIMEKQELLEALDHLENTCWLFSSKGTKRYDQVRYQSDDWLIFGSETAGLPQDLLKRCANNTLHIPKRSEIRCLNLATAAGVGLYEAWRQLGFAKLR